MIYKRIKPPIWYTVSVIVLLIMLVLKGFWKYIFNYDFPEWLGLICGFSFVCLAFYARYLIKHIEKVKLYEISEYIEVNGSKVIIDKLPKEYRYVNENISKYNPQIFKLDYEDFFEKATLTNEKGVVIQISKEDYEFLESINKDSEVK